MGVILETALGNHFLLFLENVPVLCVKKGENVKQYKAVHLNYNFIKRNHKSAKDVGHKRRLGKVICEKLFFSSSCSYMKQYILIDWIWELRFLLFSYSPFNCSIIPLLWGQRWQSTRTAMKEIFYCTCTVNRLQPLLTPLFQVVQ